MNVSKGRLNLQQLHDTIIISASKIITERSKPTRSSLPHVRLLPRHEGMVPRPKRSRFVSFAFRDVSEPLTFVT